MRSLLSNKRKKLAEANSLSQYLKYAVGEVVLVVIGILIALSINNWNINRLKNEKIDAIGKQIITDLEADTASIRVILDHYEPLEGLYKQVIGDSLSLEELMECDDCQSLAAGIIPFTPKEAGFNLIKNLDSKLLTKKDSLLTTTKLFYGQTVSLIELLTESLEKNTMGNLDEWKDSQVWFSDWIIGKENTGFFDYMKTSNYRNQVAYFYLLQYKNYIPILKSYSTKAKELANMWRKELGMEEYEKEIIKSPGEELNKKDLTSE